MSLTSFVGIKDVRERLKPLRAQLPHQIPAELKVEPKTNHYSLVGTAFDYLLRFELQRRAPHALTGPWVAEYATGLPLGPHAEVIITPRNFPPDFYGSEAGERTRAVVANAKASLADFVQNKAPIRSQFAELAGHAIRLAKLDLVRRAHYLDPRFDEADAPDVEDLLSLLEAVPIERMLDSKTMLLNPTFGESSGLVGGADADLVTGDLLVDVKTVTKGAVNPKDLDQLLGYFLLARHEQSIGATFPEIKHAGIYFARHGYLWTFDVAMWVRHPMFVEIEDWFFKRAKEQFQSPKFRAVKHMKPKLSRKHPSD